MNSKAINDITKFIFMNNSPKKCDVILIPGTSKSAITENAIEKLCQKYQNAENILWNISQIKYLKQNFETIL